MRPSVEANLPVFLTHSASQQRPSPLSDTSDSPTRDSFAQSLRTQTEASQKGHTKPLTREQERTPTHETSEPPGKATGEHDTPCAGSPSSGAEANAAAPAVSEIASEMAEEPSLMALAGPTEPVTSADDAELAAVTDDLAPELDVTLEQPTAVTSSLPAEGEIAESVKASLTPTVKTAEPTVDAKATVPTSLASDAAQDAVDVLATSTPAAPITAEADGETVLATATTVTKLPTAPFSASANLTTEPLADEPVVAVTTSPRQPIATGSDAVTDLALEDSATNGEIKLAFTPKQDDIAPKSNRVAGEVAFVTEPLVDAPVAEEPPAASKLDLSTRFNLPSGLVAVGGRVAVPVTARFGSETWASEIAEQSAKLAFAKIHSAELQLDPPELGPLSVRIHIQQDQAVVNFVAANAAVKDALDSTMAKLKEMLQEQGLNLVDANVQDQSQQQRQRRNNADAQAHFNGDKTVIAGNQTLSSPLTLSSGIDYFV